MSSARMDFSPPWSKRWVAAGTLVVVVSVFVAVLIAVQDPTTAWRAAVAVAAIAVLAMPAPYFWRHHQQPWSIFAAGAAVACWVWSGFGLSFLTGGILLGVWALAVTIGSLVRRRKAASTPTAEAGSTGQARIKVKDSPDWSFEDTIDEGDRPLVDADNSPGWQWKRTRFTWGALQQEEASRQKGRWWRWWHSQ